MPKPYTGGCLCGEVRYQLNAEPLTLYACHCTDCQRQSGGAFNLSMLVQRQALERLRGSPARFSARLEGDRLLDGWLCTACGARLWSEPPKVPQIAILRPGTLDDTRWLRPVGHIWTRSAQPWVRIPDDTLNYEGQPPDMIPLIQAWQARARA